MKQSDKFLFAIVIAIILLVVAAFVVVLIRPQPIYRDTETPEDIVFNYLLALQQEDYERALDLLSKDVPNRPQNAAEMELDIKQESWQFERYGDPSLNVSGSRISGDSATVTIIETRSDNPILGDVYSEEITIRLIREDGNWKLIEGQAYWSTEWEEDE
jgi:hypothetical protein